MGAQMLRRTVRPSPARPGCIEMFKQIVVGVDEHEGGCDAIALARHLPARDGQLTLAHVLPHDGHGYCGRSAAYEASGWASAAQLLEMVREETGVDAHLRRRVSGSAGRGLHELCELIGADLLAVGSSRRGLLGRVLMSDDTPAALNGAPCAIAIAPANYSHEPVSMREIGVGYNGSPESEHALELARRLAASTGGKALGVRGRRAFDQPVQCPGVAAERYGRPAGERSEGSDHSGGRRRGPRSLWRRRGGARALQRVARPADRRLARLWADRPADPRKHVHEAGAHGPLPAAGAAMLGARGRSQRGGRGRSRTRGGTEEVSIAVRLSRTRSSVRAPSRTAAGAVECSDRGCSR